MYINEVNLNLGPLTYNNSPNKIILHHAEASNCSVQDVNRWHKEKGWSGVGYHYFIRKDGSIYRGRPEEAQGAHCSGQNCESIGICFEGSYMTETMPQEQLNSGAQLISDIRSRRGDLSIYGHKEFYATDCPGINFPVDSFKSGTYTINEAVISAPVEVRVNWDNVIADLQNQCNSQGFSNQTIDSIPGANTLNGCPQLELYSSGDITRCLQKLLNRHGYGLVEDGEFGNNTLNSVLNFQMIHGLSADGIVGHNTWSKLLGL